MVICFGDVLSNFIYIFYASPVHTEDVDDSDENCDPLWDIGALICLHVNKCRSDMTSFFYDQVHNFLLPTATRQQQHLETGITGFLLVRASASRAI